MKFLLILVFCLSINNISSAQWDCRSKLPANLKPILANSPLTWGIEGTFGQGRLSDRDISNIMIFGALDYSKVNHQLYFENGWKYWRNADTLGTHDKSRFGPRELFYRYNRESGSLVAGLQSMTFGDYLLVNERAIGINLDQKLGAFDISMNAASVLDNYSRYGTFCSVKYLYDIIPGRSYPFQGESVGETNFGGIVLTWSPSKKKKAKAAEESSTSIDEDEFEEFDEFEESDEFEETDEFDEFEDTSEFDEFTETDEFDEFEAVDEFAPLEEKTKKKWLKKAGLIFYEEFGSEIDKSKYYFGALAELSLLWEIKFESEMLYQRIDKEQALIYFLRTQNEHVWNFGSRTSWSAAYYGKYDIDDNAAIGLSFSNLFIGEVVRLDAMDMPLYQVAIKHNLPPIKTHFKLQVTGQLDDHKINEIDLAIGKTFMRKYKLTGIFSRIESDILDEAKYMARLELRAIF
ncbi:MAG: hypothetical protein GY839_16075 [candidate division Zixibacteria bacterium]|nr:hypothetical protein [candidate division Zixibacteria bacterium]